MNVRVLAVALLVSLLPSAWAGAASEAQGTSAHESCSSSFACRLDLATSLRVEGCSATSCAVTYGFAAVGKVGIPSLLHLSVHAGFEGISACTGTTVDVILEKAAESEVCKKACDRSEVGFQTDCAAVGTLHLALEPSSCNYVKIQAQMAANTLYLGWGHVWHAYKVCRSATGDPTVTLSDF